MNKKEKIQGKVAAILNTREVAFNIGEAHGVKYRMLFDIFPKSKENVKDPDSKELIGVIYRPKVRVRVESVDQKYSIARTYRTKSRQSGINFWANLQIDTDSEPETLKKSDAEFEDLHEFESYVSIGDPVEQVSE